MAEPSPARAAPFRYLNFPLHYSNGIILLGQFIILKDALFPRKIQYAELSSQLGIALIHFHLQIVHLLVGGRQETLVNGIWILKFLIFIEKSREETYKGIRKSKFWIGREHVEGDPLDHQGGRVGIELDGSETFLGHSNPVQMTVTLKLIDHILEKNRSSGGIPLLRRMVRVKAEVGGRRTDREEVGRVDIERSRQVDEAAKGRGGKPTCTRGEEGRADKGRVFLFPLRLILGTFGAEFYSIAHKVSYILFLRRVATSTPPRLKLLRGYCSFSRNITKQTIAMVAIGHPPIAAKL